MIIRATSDLHGNLPHIDDCNVLIIAGDICPTDTLDFARRSMYQLVWLENKFAKWLQALVDRNIRVIGIAGNHDFVFEEMKSAVDDLNLPWTYLCDSSVVVDGIKFYGTPWVPKLKRWAFHATPMMLNARADAIPDDVDVLISHGPPEQVLDRTIWGERVGDYSLNYAIRRAKPSLVVCGHIHEAHGDATMNDGNTLVKNVSLLDEKYQGEYISRPVVI